MTTGIRQADPKALKVHPLAYIIPDMRPDEWDNFYRDICTRGIKVPIEVWGDGTVLDGRHRLKAALEANLPRVPIMDAPLNSDTPEEYMIKAAILRRHLTDDQRATIAYRWSQGHKQEPTPPPPGPGRGHTTEKALPPRGGNAFMNVHKTQTKASEAFKVSRKKIDKAAAVAKESNELFESVRTGKKSLNAAYKEARKATEERNPRQFPQGKYQVIYADPPWQYANSGLAGGAEDHYATLSMAKLVVLQDSAARKITDLAGDTCVLFLWVTAPFLPEALELCEAWGFNYKTHFVWLKDKSTYGKLGFYLKSQHELLFIATKGSCLPREGSLEASIIYAEKGEHSAKPELAYTIIEKMYSGPYVELFARHPRQSWESWGTL